MFPWGNLFWTSSTCRSYTEKKTHKLDIQENNTSVSTHSGKSVFTQIQEDTIGSKKTCPESKFTVTMELILL